MEGEEDKERLEISGKLWDAAAILETSEAYAKRESEGKGENFDEKFTVLSTVISQARKIIEDCAMKL